MSDASSLHCPNCGAAVDPDARRCPYCRARLATISCPSCFALMFDGAAYCPKCGSRRARTAGDSTSARCPGCDEALHRVDLAATVLLECSACDGVWIEAEVFERLCTDREAQAAVLHRLAPGRQTAQRPVRYRPCVQCGKMMNRVNFGKVSGTVVDVCRGHGTFLDAGELHQIVEFIHGGGLERARERQIEELRERERHLHELERQAARDRGAADPHRALGLSQNQLPAGSLLDLIRMMRRNS
jgi:Zn-finger nucleic acid-binding protein